MKTKKIKSNKGFLIIIIATFFLSSLICIKTSVAINMTIFKSGLPIEKVLQDNGKIEAAKKKLKASKNLKSDCEKMITEYINENEKLQTENMELKSENILFKQSTNALSLETEALKKKLEIAKVLNVYNIEVAGYKVAKKESKPAIKAKEINRITGTFEIAGNAIAEAGNKEIYMIIYDTKGGVLGSSANKLISKSNRKKQGYSATKTVAYTNSKIKVDISFDCTQVLVKGKYNVEFFIDGVYSEKIEFIIE